MKNYLIVIIILVLSFFVGLVAYADVNQIPVPEPFVNSRISRVLKDGTVQTFGDEYAIVKRAAKKKVATPTPVKEVEVVKTVEVTKTVEVVKEQPRLKHRISLLAGQGYQKGLDRHDDINRTEIESRYGMVYGIQYQYLMWERVNLGLELLNQNSCLGSVGYDF